MLSEMRIISHRIRDTLTSMKTRFFSLMFMTLAAFVVSASATVPVYSCSDIVASTGVYVLQNDLSPASGICAEITGYNAASPALIEIDLNGHTATTQNNYVFYVHDNAGAVYIHNGTVNRHMTFDYSNVNNAIWVWNSGTGANNWTGINTVTVTQGSIWCLDSPYCSVQWAYLYGGGVSLSNGSNNTGNHNLADHIYVDTSSGLHQAYGWAVGCFGDYCTATNISLIAHTHHFNVMTCGQNGNDGDCEGTDDGVVYGTYDHIYIDTVYVKDAYDAAIEGGGRATATNVHIANVVSEATAGWSPAIGFGCDGYAFGCGMDTVTIDNIVVNQNSVGSTLIFINGDSSGLAYEKLKDVTISNCTINPGTAGTVYGSAVGYPSAWFSASELTTISNVTLTNNHWGSTVTLQDTSSNYIDGGNNYCVASYPTGNAINCH